MRLTTRRLGPVLSTLAGVPVRVILGDEGMHRQADGACSHDGAGYVIALRPAILKYAAAGNTSDVARLGHVVRHEAAHAYYGDSRKAAAPAGAPSAADWKEAAAFVASPAGKAVEERADALAAEWRRVLTDAQIWQLVQE
jgi:hypothetical protein